MSTAGTYPQADAPPRKGGRRADHAAAHAFRPWRRWPAVIASVVLMALGIIAAIEIISALFGGAARVVPYEPLWRWATSAHWNEPAMLTGAAVAALLGIILLLAALIPGRPRFVPLRSGDRDLIMGMQRRSFTNAVRHAVEDVDGVREAKARLRRGRVRVTATTSLLTAAPRLTEAVRQAAAAKIRTLAPVSTPDVKVTVRDGKGRRHGT
ncbi:hypothetical protein DP939_41325 [Spongiactinospora rosea]|uniref:DUF6286 domain-containing protein n=1 Tax=Spongiactinospora rosea TaxID=2248750 RepID=A0A366LK38_9ACTN|nr:DUF6286 domain-containing protein [Spongiactinospora rosea]RBQ14261.1 hypothetical protein DP939_41325 [Spongiactinospora rosea]